MRLGALEAGGTKMVCSIGDETGRVFSRVSYPTLSPAETMPRLIEFFKSESIDALGVASFGPIDLHQDSPTYGYITSTPKKGWTNYPFLPELREAIGVPCGYDNDVNAAGGRTWMFVDDVSVVACQPVTNTPTPKFTPTPSNTPSVTPTPTESPCRPGRSARST